MLITTENRKYLLLVWTSVLSCLPLLRGEASDWLRGYNISSFPSPGLFPASSSEAKERNCSRKINYLWWCKTATLKLREGGRAWLSECHLFLCCILRTLGHSCWLLHPDTCRCTTCHVSRVQCHLKLSSVTRSLKPTKSLWWNESNLEIKLQELQINLAHFSASLSSPHCLQSGSWMGPGPGDQGWWTH